jgi:hypothetical protein
MFSIWFVAVRGFMYMLWADYTQYVNYLNFNIEYKKNRIIKRSNPIFIKLFFSTFIYGFLYLYFILVCTNTELKLFYVNEFIFSQIQWFSTFFLLTLFVLFKFANQLSKYTTDVGFLFVQLYYMIVLLLTANNLLSVFLVLEVVNVLIIYSFFVTTTLNITSSGKFLFKDNWILKTCVYQFILNFFSSIFFFWAYNLLIGLTQSTNFFFLTHISPTMYPYNLYISLLYLSFFIKLGIGPWIFFKIEIYQNFNLILIILYTVIYFLGILFFFFNLFTVYGLPLTNLFIIGGVLTILVISLIFMTNLFNYFNIFMFFSFSSLAHLCIFLTQFLLLFVMFE